MKKILLMSSVVSMFFGTINAQSAQTTPSVRAKEKVSEITRLGGVEPQQIGKINNLFIDFYTKQDELRTNIKVLGPKEFDKQMAELKTKHNAALKEVLSAEQVEKFEASQKAKELNQRNVPGNPNQNN